MKDFNKKYCHFVQQGSQVWLLSLKFEGTGVQKGLPLVFVMEVDTILSKSACSPHPHQPNHPPYQRFSTFLPQFLTVW